MVRRYPALVAGFCLLCASGLEAAEMSVGDVNMRPNETAKLEVSGRIDGEWTFGWSIMLELVPRPGNTGRVTFTTVPSGRSEQQRASFVIEETPGGLATVRLEQVLSPGVDIEQVVDVWRDAGTFTPFDTHRAGSPTLNGAVDDNGTFVAAPVEFADVLATFPVFATADARGIWDVMLSTPAGDSEWEGVKTGLISGSVTISPTACRADRDCRDGDPCTSDKCEAGTCQNVPIRDGKCRHSELSAKRNRKGMEAGGSTRPKGSSGGTEKPGR